MTAHSKITRRTAIGAGVAGLAAVSGLAQAQGTGPIRIGGTLALTGPLSATAQIHKVVGEIYIEQANKRGGWLGRPLQWVLLDDQSKPDVARTLYEQLVTAERRPECPRCQGRRLTRLLSTFAVSTGSGRAAAREPAGSCGTCGDPRGPGSCSS